MSLNIKALKAAAEKATPGPWIWRGKNMSLHVPGTHPYKYGYAVMSPSYDYETDITIEIGENDADFIALANPSAILELVERVEALEEALRATGRDLDTLQRTPFLSRDDIGVVVENILAALNPKE